MSYTYPSHFKYPDTERIFFADHIDLWESILGDLKNKPNNQVVKINEDHNNEFM